MTIYVLIKGGQCAIPPSALIYHDDFIGVNNFQLSKVIDTIKPSVWLSVAKSISDETALNGRIDCWKGGEPIVMIKLHICHD